MSNLFVNHDWDIKDRFMGKEIKKKKKKLIIL